MSTSHLFFAPNEQLDDKFYIFELVGQSFSQRHNCATANKNRHDLNHRVLAQRAISLKSIDGYSRRDKAFALASMY